VIVIVNANGAYFLPLSLHVSAQVNEDVVGGVDPNQTEAWIFQIEVLRVGWRNRMYLTIVNKIASFNASQDAGSGCGGFVRTGEVFSTESI
jgi:hypothetical protein